MEAAPLPQDPLALKDLVREQASTIDQLSGRIAQLEHHLQLLLRRQYGARSERVDPNQLQLFEAVAAQPQPAAAAEAVQVVSKRRGGGGRQTLPAELPRERIEHDLSPRQQECPGCGQQRERIGCQTSEQLEYIPSSLKVIQHVRYKYACRSCQEHVTIAEAPTKPIQKGLAGPGLLAQLVVSKWSDHLPLYRIEDQLARQGVLVSRSTLCRWAMSTAELLEPLYQCLMQRVRSSRVIWTDDTPVAVLDRSLPKTRTGRFWIYCGDREHPYSVYDYTDSRKRDGPANFLKDYQGYLQADAFAGYDGIYAAGTVKQVLCWAHARRKFYEARTVQPIPAHTALGAIGRLYDLERQLKEASVEERHAARQARALPILQEFHAWLTASGPSVLPKSPVGQAINYVLPRWDGFVRYCEDGALSIDNNLSERSLRCCAVGRKNWMFLGSDRGGRTAAILFSIMATCKAQQVEPWAYLYDILARLPNLPEDQLPDLLPDVWLQSHPDARRRWSR
jgi:transposase